MKVTSTETIHFPSLNWGINKGDVKELPKDKEAAEAILSHESISEAKEADTKQAPAVEQKPISTK